MADPDVPPSAPPDRREVRLAVRLALAAALAAAVALPFLGLLLLVEGQAEWLERLDVDLAESLHRWAIERPGVVDALDVVAVVLGPWMFRLLVVAAAAVLWVRGARRLAIWAVMTMAIGGVLGVVLKEIVERARPSFPDPVATASSSSFPSGHALNSFLGAAILLLIVLPVLGRRGRAVAWTLAVSVVALTGFDRTALGVHYLSDVVAGWIAAAAVVVGTTTAFGTWRHGRTPADGVDPAGSRRALSGQHGTGSAS